MHLSTHLLLHKCTRDRVCLQSCLNQWQSHTLSSFLSPFHSTKTISHHHHPSVRKDTLLPHTSLPASQYKTKTKTPRRPNNVSYLGSQHPHSTNAKAQFSSPTDVQQPWVTIIKGMASTQTCVVVTHNWRWYLLLLLELAQGSFCMLAVTEQVVMINCLSAAITHVYVHLNTQVQIYTLYSCAFRPP